MEAKTDKLIAVFVVLILLVCLVLPWVEIPVVDPALRGFGERYPRAAGIFLVTVGVGLGSWDYADAKSWRWMEQAKPLVLVGAGLYLLFWR